MSDLKQKLKRKRRLSVVIILSVLFELTITGCGKAEDHAPTGYLIPTLSSLPAGLSQLSKFYSPYSKDMYVLEFTAEDHVAGLTISESPETSGYQNSSENYSNSERHPRVGYQVQKIRNLERLGAKGELFLIKDHGTNEFDAIIDDNQKFVRIFAVDGSRFHFTPEMIMDIVNGLVRQQ